MDYIIKKAGFLSPEDQSALGIFGIPQDWPIEVFPYVDVVPDGFELVTASELSFLKANLQASYDAWLQSLRPILPVIAPAPTEVIVKSGELSAVISAPMDNNPFAVPTYRTKRSKTANLAVVAPGASSVIDFILTQERYVSGGCIIVANAQFGDYVTAEVYDIYGGIPAAYRSALCENWPTVSQYIEGEWIRVNPSNIGEISIHEIDTHPLSAKITAGLSLRLTYFAVNTGVDRKFGVNYYLTKKL